MVVMNEKKKKLVPALRFSGFEGDWEVKELKKACTINPKNKELSDSFIYIDLESVSDGLLHKENLVQKSNAPSRAQRVLEKNDILFQMVRPYQKNNFFFNKDGFFVASTGYAQMRTTNEAQYIYQYIHTELFVNKVNVRCTGTSYPAINSSDLSNIKISIPTLPEQQKIANFLSSVDKKIEQLRQKVSLLEEYKKGVLQQIFSQQIRFKEDDGTAFADWEVKKLGEVSDKVNSKNKNNLVNFVLTNSATQGIVSQQDYFDKDIANQNNLGGYYIVDKDDFIYNPRISKAAPVGPVKRNKLIKGVMSPLYTVFRFSKGNLAFLEYFFETPKWHKYMKSIANYGARHDRMNITSIGFQKMPIPFPSLPEQQKIANYLSSLDNKIEQVQTQLKEAEQFKKGLLQQLFV